MHRLINCHNLCLITVAAIISIILFALSIKHYDYSNVLYMSDLIHETSTTFGVPEKLSQNLDLWTQRPDSIDLPSITEVCSEILQSSESKNIRQVLKYAKKWTIPNPHTDESILALVSNCTNFLRKIPFATRLTSKEEARFPLAYVFLGSRNAAQSVRLFRLLYRPHNAYCLAYDNKSSEAYKKTIQQLANCFSAEKNIFLNPYPEPVHYALYSILHTVMACMKVLLDSSRTIPWRYVQIVSWNDFPLRTNAEMVRIFQILNGSQDSALDPLVPEFFVPVYDENMTATSQRRTVAPDGLTVYKGSFATSMTKEIVEFLFKNPTSIRFFQWLNNSECAEEHYWATIIHNLHLSAPGSFPGQCLYFYKYRKTWKRFISRFQLWEHDQWHRIRCKGQYDRSSCVYGVADIPTIITRPELMAHKIYEEFQPATSFCLEQWYWKKYQAVEALDEGYYRRLPSVRYQATVNKNSFIC